MKSMSSILVMGIFLVISAVSNIAFAEDYCQTDNNTAGIPNSCSANNESGWQYNDCSVTCHVGKAVCNQGQWIKDPNGGCGYVIQPICYCSGN